jgi:broad specificity phosphatase PhoE
MILTDYLVERDHGIIGGVAKAKAQQMMDAGGFDWLGVPECESTDAIDFRVRGVVSMIERDYPGQTVLISTHEDIVRSLFRVLKRETAQASMLHKIENSKAYRFS